MKTWTRLPEGLYSLRLDKHVPGRTGMWLTCLGQGMSWVTLQLASPDMGLHSVIPTASSLEVLSESTAPLQHLPSPTWADRDFLGGQMCVIRQVVASRSCQEMDGSQPKMPVTNKETGKQNSDHCRLRCQIQMLGKALICLFRSALSSSSFSLLSLPLLSLRRNYF